MPKQKVALTKVKKKGRENKEKLVDKIQDSANKYKYMYVLSYQNMTTNPFNKIRKDFEGSKFFLGKNKVMQYALGRTPEEEFKENLCLAGRHIKQECCLLFTNEENVEEYFNNFSSKDFARAGAVAPKTIALPKGPEALETLSFAMEPHLRQLGLPTKLVRQKIHLIDEVTLAEEGKVITAENAKILKLLGHRLAEFKLKVVAKWTAATHEVEVADD